MFFALLLIHLITGDSNMIWRAIWIYFIHILLFDVKTINVTQMPASEEAFIQR